MTLLCALWSSQFSEDRLSPVGSSTVISCCPCVRAPTRRPKEGIHFRTSGPGERTWQRQVSFASVMKEENKHVNQQNAHPIITVQQWQGAQVQISWGLMTRDVSSRFCSGHSRLFLVKISSIIGQNFFILVLLKYFSILIIILLSDSVTCLISVFSFLPVWSGLFLFLSLKHHRDAVFIQHLQTVSLFRLLIWTDKSKAYGLCILNFSLFHLFLLMLCSPAHKYPFIPNLLTVNMLNVSLDISGLFF